MCSALNIFIYLHLRLNFQLKSLFPLLVKSYIVETKVKKKKLFHIIYYLAPVVMLDVWYIEEHTQTDNKSFELFWRVSITHSLHTTTLYFQHNEQASCFHT